MLSCTPAAPAPRTVQGLSETLALKPSDFPRKGRRCGHHRDDQRGPQSPWAELGTRRRGSGTRPAPTGTSRPPGRVVRPLAEWTPAPRPLVGRLEKHAATVAGGQSEGGGPAGAALRGHGGCGTAGGSSALAAVRRPRRTAGRLVLTLLPWLRPAGSRSPLPQHPALGARRQRGPQRALVGSLPGHAEAGARWVTPGGQCAGGRQPSGAQQTAGAPSPTFPGAAYWKCPVGLARVPKHDGVLGRLNRVGTRCLCTAPRLPGRAEVLFSGCRSLKCLEQPLRTRPWVLLLGRLWAAAVETSDPCSPLAFSYQCVDKD